MIGATVDHGLHDVDRYASAADDVRAAVERARDLPEADGQRVALWFFSNGGLLAADWIDDPPDWLRGVALTYPRLRPPAEWRLPARFGPVEAVMRAGDLPLLLTRAGREAPELAATVTDFAAAATAAGATLEVIDVPTGRHGFDMHDDSDELDDVAVSRAAVHQAVDWVTRRTRQEPESGG